MAGYTVTGAAVVLRVLGGSGQEHYLYRGAVLDSDHYLKKSIDHVESLGLIKALPEETAPVDAGPAPTPTPPATPATPAGAPGAERAKK